MKYSRLIQLLILLAVVSSVIFAFSMDVQQRANLFYPLLAAIVIREILNLLGNKRNRQ